MTACADTKFCHDDTIFKLKFAKERLYILCVFRSSLGTKSGMKEYHTGTMFIIMDL